MDKRYYLGEFEEIVLLLVGVQHNQAYGLSITKAIEKELGRSVLMSSVHTALYRLEEKGYVISRLGGASKSRGGRKKRIFILTKQGRSAISASQKVRTYLWQRMPKFVLQHSEL